MYVYLSGHAEFYIASFMKELKDLFIHAYIGYTDLDLKILWSVSLSISYAHTLDEVCCKRHVCRVSCDQCLSCVRLDTEFLSSKDASDISRMKCVTLLREWSVNSYQEM